ncbi:hypothetical protein NT6N_16860 [Oceaniferula spumae]|uniref:Uncharacterized protein n=1 Tax=Oceaniferula spumae TaxID=2979115 RepID=A0AAT9FL28_9BACT
MKKKTRHTQVPGLVKKIVISIALLATAHEKCDASEAKQGGG